MSFFLILHREWQLLLTRGGAAVWYTLGFFVVTTLLFPFTLGTDSALLQTIAPSILWINALLAALLPVATMMVRDQELGMLEQYHLHGVMPFTLILAKLTFHWLTTGLPLLVLIPVMGILFSLENNVLMQLAMSLFPGTLTFSILGTMAAALTLGARRAEMLIPLLVLPLVIPVVIFGASAALGSNESALPLLWGVTLLFFPLCMAASVLALKQR